MNSWVRGTGSPQSHQGPDFSIHERNELLLLFRGDPDVIRPADTHVMVHSTYCLVYLYMYCLFGVQTLRGPDTTPQPATTSQIILTVTVAKKSKFETCAPIEALL